MALTTRTSRILVVACSDKKAAAEIQTVLDTTAAKVAATVAAIAVPASATSTDNANKINEVIAALKAAGLML